MKIAIHGLGKMGRQIARKLAEDGHEVLAHNRSVEPMDEAVQYGATKTVTKQAVLDAFGSDRTVIWLMLPDTVTNSELSVWLDIVPAGSLIIDGGNSDFRQTITHAELATAKQVSFMDVGTSGGIMGQENGFCLMAGGEKDDFAVIEAALKTLAAPNGSYGHFGPAGAGHFVKMVHNAVEYGMMESLAEGYNILKQGPYQNLDLGKVGELWQHGSVVESLLNRLAGEVLHNNPELDETEGYVAESGEARWTLEVATQKQLPAPAIQAAMDVRKASQQGQVDFRTKLLAEMRHAFGGHDINKAGQ